MAIQRWDPFGDLRRVDRLFRLPHGRSYNGSREGWTLPLDVVDEGEKVVVKASLAGFKPEEIHVTVEDGVLAIKAETEEKAESNENGYLLRERRSGSFYRSLRLPESVDAENVESTYENGVLSVRLPRVESKKAKVIEVKAA